LISDLVFPLEEPWASMSLTMFKPSTTSPIISP
jgi:hypothetical protein